MKESVEIRGLKFLKKIKQKVVFVPTHLGGGEELYTQTGFFFVQSILAERYIHRREM